MYIRVQYVDKTIYEYSTELEDNFAGLSQLSEYLRNNAPIWAYKVVFDALSGKHTWKSNSITLLNPANIICITLLLKIKENDEG